MMVANSRKKCPVTYSKVPLFFSLVDYRNNYFTSNDPNKIIEFYNDFENRDQLIQWMRERPKGVANIHEVEGDKEIVVVIPTADFSGKYARECRDNIFKGLHIIFVESGEIPDPYFNFAHNMNVGIKKAMEYNPKWVVVSNDDMRKKSSPSTLISELNNLNNSDKKAIFVKNSKVSPRWHISKRTIISKFLDTWKKYRNDSNYFKGVEIFRKFGVSYYFVWGIESLFYSHESSYVNTGSFCCYSGIFCNSLEGKIYDETFINSAEDLKLSMLLTKHRQYYSFFKKYDIINIGGATLGSSTRGLRDVSGMVYLNYELCYNDHLR